MADIPDREQSSGEPGVATWVAWLVVGGVAAMGIALFVMTDPLRIFRWHGRPTVSEAKANLKAGYTAQRAYFQEKDTYGTDVVTVGFEPERGNRYAYFFAPSGPVEQRGTATAAAGAGTVIVAADTYKYPHGFVPPRFGDTHCPITPLRTAKGRTLTQPGVYTGFEDAAFLIGAVGNIDKDGDFDCWSIASEPRTAADGHAIAAGEPYCEKSDL